MSAKRSVIKVSPFLLLLFLAANLAAQGRIVVPQRPELLPGQTVFLKQVATHVNINDGIATTRLEQVFCNPSAIQLAGQYLYTLPDEAEVDDFHLYVEGRKTRGEILDSGKARDIYEDIVRKLRDPALLEYAGHGLFRARIFPIQAHGEGRIELSYAQVINYQSGTHKFTLPIRQSRQASFAAYDIEIALHTRAPIATIYSPSHNVVVERQSETVATIRLTAEHLPGDKDFLLYYTLSDREINASVLSFRPRTDRDGFFILLAEPKFRTNPAKHIPKDVIFVFDTSGSMAGEKLAQARAALRYCVNSLNAKDRFEIIRFNSDVEGFQGSLQPVSQEGIRNACYFIDNFAAAGGTNIQAALQRALALKRQPDTRPTSILFLTDGLPTEGETDIRRLADSLTDVREDFIRVFCFGVGYDVNTFLLDKLAADSQGSTNYVKPGESIEREVSLFFAKNISPALTNVQLDFGDLGVYDVYPREIPDLFQGQRLTVIGRYRSPGPGKVTLSGTQAGRVREYQYDLTFPGRQGDNVFVANLWANRKVQHLLTEIRFHGDNEELVESIRKLGKEYGIVTPYTSYLVTEQEKELTRAEERLRHDRTDFAGSELQARQRARQAGAATNEEADGSGMMLQVLQSAPASAAASVGKDAVLASRMQKRMAAGEQEAHMLLTIRHAAGRSFTLRQGVWVEDGLEKVEHVDVVVIFLSEPYFELSRCDAGLNKILALGDKIHFRWQGRTYRIATR
jgi:Ca-activated chloride channel family protein